MKITTPVFWITLCAGALCEAFSFGAFFHPAINIWLMGSIALATLILSLKNLRFGLLIIMAELTIGSQGYLFSLDVGGSRLSLRIILWIIIMAIWTARELVAVLRRQPFLERYRNFPYARQLAVVGIALVLGIFVGLLGHNDSSYFFLESKRWLYCLILLPFISEFRTRENVADLWRVMLAGAGWLTIKSLTLIYILSHGFVPLMFNAYDWMRLTLLGEITRLPSGFSRVFMQSQVFLVPLFFFLFNSILYKKDGQDSDRRVTLIQKFLTWLTLGLTASVLIASLSRSFWVGLVSALLSGFIAVIVFYWPGLRTMGRFIVLAVVSLVLGGALVFAVVRFPFPNPGLDLNADVFKDRASQMEAGAASRWSLLPVMGREILRSPLWGFGFGKTLTYITSDPRVILSTVDGRYTTYAFEWGWLDIALKLGAIGILAYVWLLWSIISDAWKLIRREAFWGMVVLTSTVALVALHFFTPYLNHPLGFGYLVLLMLSLAIKIPIKASTS